MESPNDKPEAIDRKVRNWLSGKTKSVSKQDAYIIGRVLQLSLEQTNEFLQYSTGESVHRRDSEDGDDTFRSLNTRMDTMPNACGFPQLDPRNPFDWIIIFCISSGDLWESDARLRKILMKTYASISLPDKGL